MNIYREMQAEINGKYETTYIDRNRESVYKSLSTDFAARYIGKAQYIKSIRRRNNYDGTQTYTVNYNNGTRAVYVVSIY